MPGPAGVRQTLSFMREFANAGKLRPEIRFRALSLVQRCGSKNWECEAIKLRDFVREQIAYRKDITGVETLQTPSLTLKLAAGDCDDKSVLFSALAESIGHQTRFVAVGLQRGKFQHVAPQIMLRRNGERAANWTWAELTEPWDLGYFPNVAAMMVQA